VLVNLEKGEAEVPLVGKLAIAAAEKEGSAGSDRKDGTGATTGTNPMMGKLIEGEQ